MQLLSLLTSNFHNEERCSFWNVLPWFTKGEIRINSDQFGYGIIFTDEMIGAK